MAEPVLKAGWHLACDSSSQIYKGTCHSTISARIVQLFDELSNHPDGGVALPTRNGDKHAMIITFLSGPFAS